MKDAPARRNPGPNAAPLATPLIALPVTKREKSKVLRIVYFGAPTTGKTPKPLAFPFGPLNPA